MPTKNDNQIDGHCVCGQSIYFGNGYDAHDRDLCLSRAWEAIEEARHQITELTQRVRELEGDEQFMNPHVWVCNETDAAQCSACNLVIPCSWIGRREPWSEHYKGNDGDPYFDVPGCRPGWTLAQWLEFNEKRKAGK